MLLGLGLLGIHWTENRGGMLDPDLGGWEHAKGGESAKNGPNRMGYGLGERDRANASNTDEHWD